MRRCAGILLASLVLAGCGDSGDDDTPAATSETATTAATDAAYTKQLDALCKAGNETFAPYRARAAALDPKIGAAKTAAERRRYLRETADQLRAGYKAADGSLAKMKQLDVPAAERAFHTAFLAQVQATTAAGYNLADALAVGDPQRIEAGKAQLAQVNNARLALLVKHGGFRYCGGNR